MVKFSILFSSYLIYFNYFIVVLDKVSIFLINYNSYLLFDKSILANFSFKNNISKEKKLFITDFFKLLEFLSKFIIISRPNII